MNISKQTFLDNLHALRTNKEQPSEMRMLNWNIRSPSVRRAIEQVNWIIKANANVIILTEARYSKGGYYIKDRLESFGFNTFFPKPVENDYCVIVASKGLISKELKLKIDFLPHRLVSILCDTFLGKMKIIGTYVPSRGPIERRNVNKRIFQDQLMNLLKHLSNEGKTSNLVIGGDLNVIERNHVPHYSIFGDWEYKFYESFLESGLVDAYRLLHLGAQEHSWFGKKGDRYRFDHFFVSKELSRHIEECSYLHAPRISKLSDHSAMFLKLVEDDSPK